MHDHDTLLIDYLQLYNSGLPRNILVITDGGVSNTYDVIAYVNKDHVTTGCRYDYDVCLAQ